MFRYSMPVNLAKQIGIQSPVKNTVHRSIDITPEEEQPKAIDVQGYGSINAPAEKTTKPEKNRCEQVLRCCVYLLTAASIAADTTGICDGLKQAKDNDQTLLGFLPIAKNHAFYPEVAAIATFYFLADWAFNMPWANQGFDDLKKFLSSEENISRKRKLASTLLSLVHLYAAVADGASTYYFFSVLDEKFKGFGVPLGVACAFTTFAGEGVYGIKTILDESLKNILCAKNPEPGASDAFSSRFSQIMSPLLAFLASLPGTIDDYIQSYVTMAAVFPELKNTSFLLCASAANGYSDLIYTRKLHINVLDLFFKKIADIFAGNYPTLRQSTVFCISSFFAAIFADSYRQVTLSLFADPDAPVPFSVPDYAANILSWSMAIRYGMICTQYLNSFLIEKLNKLCRRSAPPDYKALEDAQPAKVITSSAATPSPRAVNGLFPPAEKSAEPQPRVSRCRRLMSKIGCVVM